jgi:uncharacterized protein YnzC (UPF0291/DUF896 family)
MLRPSNAAHATETRQATLPKPTSSIAVPEGTSMQIKDLAKNAESNPKTGFSEVKIKVGSETKQFVFVEDDNGAIRLLPSDEAEGLKPANKHRLQNHEGLIPLPEGGVTTTISSQVTPPVSTSLGDKARGLVGTTLYKDGKRIKYLAVSPDEGATYYLEEAKNLFDEQGNLRTNLGVKVVGSDIDLLAVLSRDGKLNNIAMINELASQHPEIFNALVTAFSTRRPGVHPLTLEGETFRFPSAASDIQHGPQIPYAVNKLAKKATEGILTPPEFKHLSNQQIKQYINEYIRTMKKEDLIKTVEDILVTNDERTVLTIKGKNYSIPVRDVPMLYRLLGHEFAVEAYLL